MTWCDAASAMIPPEFATVVVIEYVNPTSTAESRSAPETDRKGLSSASFGTPLHSVLTFLRNS